MTATSTVMEQHHGELKNICDIRDRKHNLATIFTEKIKGYLECNKTQNVNRAMLLVLGQCLERTVNQLTYWNMTYNNLHLFL